MTGALRPEVMGELRQLFFAAFDNRFDEHDWGHALGGHHFIARDSTTHEIVGQASVVPRVLLVGGQPVRTGYVEAVSVLPARQGEGIGRRVMEEVSRAVRSHFHMGALSTSVPEFYRRLGWDAWEGPVLAYDGEAEYPVPEEEGGVLVLRFGPSRDLDLTLPISAPQRPGDVW